MKWGYSLVWYLSSLWISCQLLEINCVAYRGIWNQVVCSKLFSADCVVTFSNVCLREAKLFFFFLLSNILSGYWRYFIWDIHICRDKPWPPNWTLWWPEHLKNEKQMGAHRCMHTHTDTHLNVWCSSSCSLLSLLPSFLSSVYSFVCWSDAL